MPPQLHFLYLLCTVAACYLLYLIICCLSLCRCYIHIIKFNRDINIIIRRLFQLGQKDNRLNMNTMSKLVYRLDFLYGVAVGA